jgi:hypothetical protein
MKKIRFAWIIELALFFIGFYLVYDKFLAHEPQTTSNTSVVVSESTQAAGIEVDLKKAVVCIDIDEGTNMPLLPKKAFNKYIDYLYCYTKVSAPHPGALMHYWLYDGQLQSSEKVRIRPDSNAAWSRMEMSPDKKGSWQVDIRLENGDLLGSTKFKLK